MDDNAQFMARSNHSERGEEITLYKAEQESFCLKIALWAETFNGNQFNNNANERANCYSH